MKRRRVVSAPTRAVTDVGPGDFVKIGSEWRRIASNTAFNAAVTPRSWVVRTQDGATHGMWDINAYAKDEDLEACE